MANTQQLRKNLIDKLKELFQLDQPDLDFGFYRVMHARAREVIEFIDHDLLDTIAKAFSNANSENSESELESIKVKVEDNFGKDAIDADGNLNDSFAQSPLGKKYIEAQKKCQDSQNNINGEDSVYYHLYRFFSRYYDNGDFVSMRYHTRETDSKARPYAIPYGGEEVMLHWANADQYYIKTSENFQNFTFDLTKSKYLVAQSDSLQLLQVPESPMLVHFKIADADEGEHGNIKSDDTKKRKFFLAKDKIVELNDAGELVVYFDFRIETDNDKISDDAGKALSAKYNSSAKGNWHLLYLTDGIISAAEKLCGELKDAGKDCSKLELYLEMLRYQVPSDGIKARILLTKYLYKYTAANTSDYFIHKNLRGFLNRELDFYIKNEIMNLDEIMNSDAPNVESYLVLLKVFRKIAGKLIDFLGQLEDFQKKLWLKKKFVIQCDYCITLDRVPAEFHDEIFKNAQQLAEWKKLGIPAEYLVKPQNTQYASGELFTDKNSAVKFHSDYLMVDTKFFSADFKQRLLAKIENFDEQCNGLLIHSENFQALNLLQERYKEQIKCVYIDPPYNTGSDNAFIYKDAYQHSSWISCLSDRLFLAKHMANDFSGFWISTDDGEYANLKLGMDLIFGNNNFVADIIWNSRKSISNDALISAAINHTTFYAKSKDVLDQHKNTFRIGKTEEGFSNPDNDPRGDWKLDPMDAPNVRKNLSYGITNPETGETFYPPNGRHWRFEESATLKYMSEGRILFGITGKGRPAFKRFLSEAQDKGQVVTTLWEDVKTTTDATKMLLDYFGDSVPKIYIDKIKPKPIQLIDRMLQLLSDQKLIAIDFFAGSGTTAHALIDLDREENGKRKYILIEMGEHFNTVLKPRIQKVVYCPDWKEGKPTTFDKGISHCFKYMRLESYEDTLNNLVMPDCDSKMQTGTGSLREDYALHYMLDTEAQESLLNIDDFANPFGGYQLNIKQSNSDASVPTPVDLIETFNYLIGLRVQQYYRIQRYKANFKRSLDPELPSNQNTRWELDGKPEMCTGNDDIADYKWCFQKIEGTVPANPLTPNDGKKKNILIVWRTLTGNLTYDNLMLDWYLKDTVNPNEKSAEYDIIYINGSNNVGANRKETDSFSVQLIEEEFLKQMWFQEEF